MLRKLITVGVLTLLTTETAIAISKFEAEPAPASAA